MPITRSAAVQTPIEEVSGLSVHNITWLGQGTFTYEKPSYLKKQQSYK
jgi:hypothetical protein